MDDDSDDQLKVTIMISVSKCFAVLMLLFSQSVVETLAGESDKEAREEFFQRAAVALDANEGPGGYEKICWNDAGAGISVGKLQWNQKRGDLPLYLKLCHRADAQLFANIFGSRTKEMLDEKFIRRTNELKSDSELGRGVKAVLRQPAFQRVQDSLIRVRLEWAVKVAREHNHSSELMVVQIADVANQMGQTGLRKSLKRCDASQLASDEEAVKSLCKETQRRRANGSTRDAYLAGRFSSATLVP